MECNDQNTSLASYCYNLTGLWAAEKHSVVKMVL